MRFRWLAWFILWLWQMFTVYSSLLAILNPLKQSNRCEWLQNSTNSSYLEYYSMQYRCRAVASLKRSIKYGIILTIPFGLFCIWWKLGIFWMWNAKLQKNPKQINLLYKIKWNGRCYFAVTWLRVDWIRRVINGWMNQILETGYNWRKIAFGTVYSWAHPYCSCTWHAWILEVFSPMFLRSRHAYWFTTIERSMDRYISLE